jgi:protoporphyrinogen oxidase
VELKGDIDSAKALLDAVNPSKNPDAFWAQVAGQVKRKRIRGKARISLITKAQTAVTQEKRTWRSDRLIGSGEIQVLFRVTDSSGTYLISGVLLRTTPMRNASVNSGGDQISLPTKERTKVPG